MRRQAILLRAPGRSRGRDRGCAFNQCVDKFEPIMQQGAVIMLSKAGLKNKRPNSVSCCYCYKGLSSVEPMDPPTLHLKPPTCMHACLTLFLGSFKPESVVNCGWGRASRSCFSAACTSYWSASFLRCCMADLISSDEATLLVST